MSAVAMTRPTGMPPSIFAPLRTRSLKATIRPNNGVGATSTKFFLTFRIDPHPRTARSLAFMNRDRFFIGPAIYRSRVRLGLRWSRRRQIATTRLNSSADGPRRVRACGQYAVERCNNLRSFPDCGGDALD